MQPHAIQPQLGAQLGAKYQVLRKIGEGAFGAIYEGRNVRTGEAVAVKLEPLASEVKLLKHESSVYQHLRGCAGIPAIKWFGKDAAHHYMVLPLLGPSLHAVFRSRDTVAWPPSQVLAVGIQITTLLQTVHDRGLVHRDVKPDNFVFGGTEATAATLHLVDFGFCTALPPPREPAVAAKATLSALVGSPNYASLASHGRFPLARKDDLESMGYMLFFFSAGALPWQAYASEADIVAAKRRAPQMHLPDTSAVPDLMAYLASLSAHAAPNYAAIRKTFADEVARLDGTANSEEDGDGEDGDGEDRDDEDEETRQQTN